jgi:hypothetical protein
MTPEELCKYIVDGKIFDDVPTGNANFEEQARDVWYHRNERLVELAKEALNANKPATDRNELRHITARGGKNNGCLHRNS